MLRAISSYQSDLWDMIGAPQSPQIDMRNWPAKGA